MLEDSPTDSPYRLSPKHRIREDATTSTQNSKRLSNYLRLVFEIPLVKTLRHYSFPKAKSDATAALNVSLLDFPQGMAYAMIAGLPYYFGIFASIIASILGPVFASSRFLMLGPTNAIAVLCVSTFLNLGFQQQEAIAAMPLLLLMIAVFMILGSLLKLANMIDYVSRTVVTGYIVAAACLIIAKQLHYMLGVELPASATFASTLYHTIRNLGSSEPVALELSILTIGIYFLVKRLLRKGPVVAITLFLMFWIGRWAKSYGIVLETLGEGEPMLLLLPFTVPVISFELIGKLAPGALAIAFLSLLESASIAKTLAAQSGDSIDTNQQMFSMGIANMGCMFFGGMPISGSLTRSALNYHSGARTSASSLISGIYLLLGFILLAPYIGQIPKTCLASLIIIVGVSLFNPKQIRLAVVTTRQDGIVFGLTLACGLFFSLNVSIFVGVISSIVLFIRKAGNPNLVEYSLKEDTNTATQEERKSPEIALLHVEGDLFFASSDLFLNEARRLANNPNLKAIVIRLRNAHNLDATCAMALEQFVRYAEDRDRLVVIAGAHQEVQQILRRSGLFDLIGAENIFEEISDNPTLSTSLALKHATRKVGEAAKLKLFISKSQTPNSNV